MRLGWIISPPGIVGALCRASRSPTAGLPAWDSWRWPSSSGPAATTGGYGGYATRRDFLVQALAEHAPDVRVTGLAAGFHAAAHLPAGAAEQEVIRAARARSVGLYGMSTYRATHAPARRNSCSALQHQPADNTGRHAVLGGILSAAPGQPPAAQQGG
jgi:GntR family transcriptional regulator / MocR family aminotransferase